MKRVYYFSIIALACAISCNKELAPSTDMDQNDDLVEIRISGTLDKELTKTAYDADGKMTWLDGDQAALIVSKGNEYSNQNRYTYELEAKYGDISSDGRTATFYGMVSQHQNTSDWLSTSFVVYPVSVSQVNDSNYYGKPFIKMPSSVSGLASSIILVGTPDSETASEVTNFFFKTAMAVLKVNITNIPASATSIRLTTTDSDSYPVDGDFTLVKADGTVTIGIGNYQGWGNGYQAVDISGEDAIDSRDFFFNIPVGSYPANTLGIEIRNGNQVLMKRAISKPISMSRNECLSIPSLLYHRVYVDGSLSTPRLHTIKPSNSSMVRVHISTEKLTAANYDNTIWREGNKFTGDTGDFNCTSLLNKPGDAALLPNAAGLYYLQYTVLKSGYSGIPDSLSDENVLTYGSVPFYYAPAGNKIPVESSWLDVPYVSTDEGAVSNLVDGNTGTHWHSPYGSEDPARNATYGQIISIDLSEGSLTTDGNFYFSFCTRNVQNDHAKAIDVYVSNVRWDDEGFDAGKVKVGSTTNALEGIYPYSDRWIKNPIICSGSGSYRYITVSILSCWGDTKGEYDLRTSGCTHMAEIEFYTK